jgi:hypothetical protein
MKECFKCGLVKPLDDFYKHSQMADGRLNKCKVCTRKDVKKNRDDNSDYYKQYDAWRFKNDPKVKERHKAYLSTPDGIERMRRAQAEWIKSNPEKRAAHTILNNSVRRGLIEKPLSCSCCGEFYPSRIIHAHHEDYSKPLDVIWMCAYCHADHHWGAK